MYGFGHGNCLTDWLASLGLVVMTGRREGMIACDIDPLSRRTKDSCYSLAQKELADSSDDLRKSNSLHGDYRN